MNVSKEAIVAMMVDLKFKAAPTWDDEKLLSRVKTLPTLPKSELVAQEEENVVLLKKVLKALKADEEIELEDEEEAPKAKKKVTKKVTVPADEDDEDSDEDSDEDDEDSDDEDADEDEDSDDEDSDDDPEASDEDEDSDDEDLDDDEDADDEEEAPKAKKKVTKAEKPSKKKAKAESNGEDEDDEPEVKVDEKKVAKLKKELAELQEKLDAKKAELKVADPRRRGFPRSAASDGGPGITKSIIEFVKLGSKKKPISKAQILEKLVERFPGRPVKGMTITLNAQLPARLVHDRKMNLIKDGQGMDATFYVEKSAKSEDDDF